MNGPIAQIVALTNFGNAFLSGDKSASYTLQNTTAQFCDRITFVVAERSFVVGRKTENVVAGSPSEWFPYLESRGINKLRLRVTPQNDPRISDRMSSGFIGGGGEWVLEAVLPTGKTERWAARWEVWNQHAPANRIWRVTYGRISQGMSEVWTPPSVEDATQRLESSLAAILRFSQRLGIEGFSQCFQKALNALTDPSSSDLPYHQDLSPEGSLRSETARLLYAVQHGWVFGGMGSWNDMSFEGDDQLEYEEVSEALFSAIREGILAASNAGRRQ